MIYNLIVALNRKDHEEEVFTLYADGLERSVALASLLEKISTPTCEYSVREIIYNPVDCN